MIVYIASVIILLTVVWIGNYYIGRIEKRPYVRDRDMIVYIASAIIL